MRRGARIRLDLPDAGILTIEEGWLGDLPDDPELVMAFGFPKGEGSIRAEENYRFLTAYTIQAGIYHLSVIGGRGDFSIPATDSPGRAALLCPRPGVGVTRGCTRSGTPGGGSMRPKFPGWGSGTRLPPQSPHLVARIEAVVRGTWRRRSIHLRRGCGRRAVLYHVSRDDLPPFGAA